MLSECASSAEKVVDLVRPEEEHATEQQRADAVGVGLRARVVGSMQYHRNCTPKRSE